MVLYAYVGWIDRGSARIYYTRDLKEAEHGLVRICIESRAKTPQGRERVRQRAREQLLEKWEHLRLP